MPTPSFLSADQLLKEHRVESSRLEFKTGWDERTKGAILRTVCAFANDIHNQNGGYIVLGVAEEGGKAVLPPVGLPAESLEKLQQEILVQITTGVKPDYVPGIFTDQVDGRDVLVIRCQTGPNRPYSAPERNDKGTSRSPHVRVGAETKLAKGELLRQLNEVSQRVPFDAQPCYDLTARNIIPDLLNSYLYEGGLSVDDDTSVEQRLRNENLLQRVNGHEAPLNAAVLFFTSEPHRRYRGAQIEIVQVNDDGDKLFEKTLRGNLPFLLSQALETLKSLNTTRVQKHDDRAEADRDVAWPFAAVEEAVVNAVHHRGYDPAFPDPIIIQIYPDRMTITSYPGPPPGLTLKDLETGELPQLVARNRRIGELLKIAKLAEARRTGIKKIRRAMEKNGNPPPKFNFDEETRTYFEVVLPIHPAHRPQSRQRALPLRVGRPAPASELVGRDSLIAQINAELDHRSVCLLGPKGRGVSSVLSGLEIPVAGERRERLDLRGKTAEQLRVYLRGLLDEPSHGTRLVLLLDHIRHIRDMPTPNAPYTELTDALLRHEHLRLVVAMESPDDLSDEAAQEAGWWEHLHTIVVPPLSAEDTRALAAGLLRSIGVPNTDELAVAVEAASCGLPDLVHRLVQALRVEPSLRSAHHMSELLESVIVARGDPTQLSGRAARLTERAEAYQRGYERQTDLKSDLLDDLASKVDGASWADLIAAQITHEGRTQLRAREAIRTLIEEGWVVERERRLSFEHSTLSDAWRAARSRESAPERRRTSAYPPDDMPYSDEDIPF
jgi:predicted HTH transcriptional regulator